METDLDEVENGTVEGEQVLENFYGNSKRTGAGIKYCQQRRY